MHIMHVITRLLRGGAEENTLATCQYQAEQGHRVTLVHGVEYDRFWYDNPIDGVELIHLPELVHAVSPISDAAAYLRLRRLYKTANPDVIHTHQSKAGVVGRLAACLLPGSVVVHCIHIVPFDGLIGMKRWIYVSAERLAARHTDVFLAVSEAVGQMFVDAGITGKDRLKTVYSGMDLTAFKGAKRPEDWHDVLGIGANVRRPRVALMMAAFEPRKRHNEFLRAFAEVAATAPDVVVVLAGQGEGEQDTKDLARALGLQNQVRFCGHRPDPEALLAMADVLVLTSEREGLPRVIVQAIAAGVPVIVNDLPGLDEIVVADQNGRIAPANDMARAAQDVIEVLSDDDTLERLSFGARGTDLDNWELEKLGERTTQFYTKPERSAGHHDLVCE